MDIPEKWPLSVQTALPDRFEDSRETNKTFALLRELGFSGVELNIADPWHTNLGAMTDLLRGENLRLLNFASGLTAKTFGLSLSTDDEAQRIESADRCGELLALFSGITAGIIIGFFKGPPSPDAEQARRQFQRSLEYLSPLAEKTGVALVVEATNRYESTVANSLDDTWSFINEFPGSAVKMLPDTFHMNIEESDMLGAFTAHLGHYSSIHLSDNNRYFPGFGALDFEALFSHFADIGFTGDVAIEGNVKGDFAKEIKKSSEALFHNMQSGQ